MENQQLSKSEILRLGIANLLNSLPFTSVEEETITLEFIKNYGLRLPSYFTLNESASMCREDSADRGRVIEEIANSSATTFRSVIGE